MFKSRKFYCFAALLACAVSSTAMARPSMWWDHFESGAASQTDCVKKAETILTAEKAGQMTSDADSVRAWSENTVSVAECIQFGDKLIVGVIVTSEDAAAGSNIFNALRSEMKRK